MASKFVLTAELQLRPPTDLRSTVRRIKNELEGFTIDVEVRTRHTDRELERTKKSLDSTRTSTTELTSEVEKFGKQSVLAARRFAAFTIATTGFIKFVGAIKDGLRDAIAFQRELVRVSQVTGTSTKNLGFLTKQITSLSSELGVASSQLVTVSRTLAQAGLTAKQTAVAMKALARTELAPTFENIGKTTEGAIAILNQFGKGVGALERQLGAMNAVAGKFAVESGDMITAVRRTGGAFKAAGGNLEELIALFTSVRQTTRESAESIATGFRTIFTRLQRPRTIEYLRTLGIELQNAKGQFVGPLEAIKKLSNAMRGLETTDPRF